MLRNLGIAKRGPKPRKYLLFVDFQKAFDSVDRTKLTQILLKRVEDPLKVTQILRLLNPQRIEMGD